MAEDRQSPESTGKRKSGGTGRLVLWAFVIAAGLNLLWLWDAPLADTTEARHAEVGREFAEGGHWLIPTLNYQPHLTKPPLTDWLVAAGIRIFGANEFGARFFGALVAALGLALLAGFTDRLAGRRAALAAAAFYFTTPIYLVLSRTISIDILLATFALGAYWAVYEASREDCSRPRLMAAIYWGLLGIGALTKGHIVLLIALLPALAWIILGRRWKLLRRMAWPPAIGLFLLLAVPWYVYIARVFPGWLGKMIANEIGQRTMGAEFGDANFGLSAAYFLAGAILCVPTGVLALVRRKERGGQAEAASGARGLLALWILLPLVVFSAVSSQRTNYIAPLVPAAAILAGLGWARLSSNWESAGFARRAAAYLTIAVLTAAAPALIFSWTLVPETQLDDFLMLASAAVLLGGVATTALLLARRAGPSRAGKAVVLAALSLWLVSIAAIRDVKEQRSTRDACRKLLNQSVGREPPVLYKTYMASVQFYCSGRLLLCDIDPVDFRWPKALRKFQEASRRARTREIWNAARKPPGAWVFLSPVHVPEFRKYSVKQGAHSLERVSNQESVLLRMVERPLTIAPGENHAAKGGTRTPIVRHSTGRLAEDLEHGDAKVREDAARALADMGVAAKAALNELRAALTDRDPIVRRLAVQAIGNIGKDAVAAAPALFGMLDDSNSAVRAHALHALVILCPEEPRLGRALLGAIRDKSRPVRCEAVWGLGEIPSPPPGTVTAVIDAAGDPSVEVRWRAARSLGNMRDGSGRATAALIACLQDSDWRVRRYAAPALGGMRKSEPNILAALVKSLEDEDWEVRRVAAWALGKIGAPNPNAVGGLVKALADEYWSTRENAARALGRIGPRAKAAVPALKKVLRDPEPQVRTSARKALRRIRT